MGRQGSVSGSCDSDRGGELSKALTVHAHAFSSSARERIEAAGGTVQLIEE